MSNVHANEVPEKHDLGFSKRGVGVNQVKLRSYRGSEEFSTGAEGGGGSAFPGVLLFQLLQFLVVHNQIIILVYSSL